MDSGKGNGASEGEAVASVRYVALERPGFGGFPAYTRTVLVKENGYEHDVGGGVYGDFAVKEIEAARPATDEEVAAFKAKRAEVAERRAREHAQEAALLALCGLTHDDFSRFRSVSRVEAVLYVRTRENGTNTRSVGAIRNANYLRSGSDDFDSTYEHYEFAIPADALA